MKLDEILEICKELGLRTEKSGSNVIMVYCPTDPDLPRFLKYVPFWNQLEITESVELTDGVFTQDSVTYFSCFNKDCDFLFTKDDFMEFANCFLKSVRNGQKLKKKIEMNNKLEQMEKDFDDRI